MSPTSACGAPGSDESVALAERLTEGLDRKLHVESFLRTLQTLPKVRPDRPSTAPAGGRRGRLLQHSRAPSQSHSHSRHDSDGSDGEVTYLMDASPPSLTTASPLESPRGSYAVFNRMVRRNPPGIKGVEKASAVQPSLRRELTLEEEEAKVRGAAAQDCNTRKVVGLG
jgi:hypothetical protein